MAANYNTQGTSNIISNLTLADEKSKPKMKDESFKMLREMFVIQDKIGSGTFSKVYLAYVKSDPQKQCYAIKHIKQTTHPEKLRREIYCLLKIGGQDNVMGLITSLRIRSSVCLVMPYIKHDHPLTYLCSMDANELRLYIKNLLIALQRIHSFNIVHRDVKPSNFLYNRSTSTFMLTDFGLAHPNINPTNRHRQMKSLPDNSSDKSSCIQNNSNQDLNVKRKRSNSAGTVHLKCQKRILQNIVDGTNSTPYVCNLRKRTKLMMPKEPLLKENSPIKKEFVVPKNNIPSSSNAVNNHLFNEKNNSFAIPKVPRLTCDCVGKLKVCNVCIKRPEMNAPRAGTPGFRAPEVLLKYKYQNTALDIWSVGVIMLEAMSRCYPFFSAENDSTCLAEMITVFGDRAIKNVAKMLGRNVICEVQKPPLDLRAICRLLCHRSSVPTLAGVSSSIGLDTCNNCLKPIQLSGCEVFSDSCSCYLNVTDDFPYPAYDLLKKLLCLNPVARITADIALKHPFFKMDEKKS